MQPTSEGQPVNNREDDEGGDAASRKESDLKDPIVRERKLIQPLHAQSNTSAAERTTSRSLLNQPNDGLAGAREARSDAAQRPGLARRLRAPNPIDARPCHIS
jgi:hypothetical protein